MSDRSDLEKIFGDLSSGQIVSDEVCDRIDDDCNDMLDSMFYETAEEFYRMSVPIPLRCGEMDDDCDGVVDKDRDGGNTVVDRLLQKLHNEHLNQYLFISDGDPLDCTEHEVDFVEVTNGGNALEALRGSTGIQYLDVKPVLVDEQASLITEFLRRGLDDPVLISTEQATLPLEMGHSMIDRSSETKVIDTMRGIIDHLYSCDNPQSMSEVLQNHYNKNRDNLTNDQRRLITEVNLGLHDSIDPLDSPFELSFLDNSLAAIAQDARVDRDNRTRLQKWYDAAYAFAPEIACKKLTFSDFVAYINENPEWS